MRFWLLAAFQIPNQLFNFLCARVFTSRYFYKCAKALAKRDASPCKYENLHGRAPSLARGLRRLSSLGLCFFLVWAYGVVILQKQYEILPGRPHA